MTKQTLTQAIHLARTGLSRTMARAAHALDGCPIGSWPETEQARRQIRDDLPARSCRRYTVDQFVDAAYRVDAADRYSCAL